MMPGKASKPAPLVSVVVLNWNGKKYLRDCFISLENQTYPDLEIIMPDNGSTDGSIGWTRDNFPKIKVIENKKNLGFAAGNNRGIEIATGKYVVVLNNDTRMEKDCLAKLVEAAENDNRIGMCAPKILSWDNHLLIDSVGVNIYPDSMSRGKGRLESDKGQYDKVGEALLPSGCCALYRKKMLDEIGLFDEDFFAYCEDTDLGLRGRLAGWQVVLAPSAIVYHHYSGTCGKYSSKKAFLVERNHFWVALKNFPLSMLILLPFYTAARYLFLVYGLLIHKGPARGFQSPKFILPLILIQAYASALKKLPKILSQRIKIQRNKKLTAKELRDLLKKYRLKISELTLQE